MFEIPPKARSRGSSLALILQCGHSLRGFECNGDLDEAAGAADAIACSGGGSLRGMRREPDCR